jgi:hypothetical protein
LLGLTLVMSREVENVVRSLAEDMPDDIIPNTRTDDSQIGPEELGCTQPDDYGVDEMEDPQDAGCEVLATGDLLSISMFVPLLSLSVYTNLSYIHTELSFHSGVHDTHTHSQPLCENLNRAGGRGVGAK